MVSEQHREVLRPLQELPTTVPQEQGEAKEERKLREEQVEQVDLDQEELDREAKVGQEELSTEVEVVVDGLEAAVVEAHWDQEAAVVLPISII